MVNTTISSQFFFKLLISAIRYPNAMKAPGANTNTNIPYSSGRMAKSNTLPVPKNSRTAPSNVNGNGETRAPYRYHRHRSHCVIFGGKGFSTAQYNTVYNDQRNKKPQSSI